MPKVTVFTPRRHQNPSMVGESETWVYTLSPNRLKGTFVEASNCSMGIPNSGLVRTPKMPGKPMSTHNVPGED